jgi:hypothetical protein
MAQERRRDYLMSTGAWIMFAVGATFLWGGLALSIMNYLRSSRRRENR